MRRLGQDPAASLASSRTLGICAAVICLAVVPAATLLFRRHQELPVLDRTRCGVHPQAVGQLAAGSGELAAAGGHASLPPRTPPPTCHLAVKPSVFADSCTLLEDVCVDQGRAVLYDPRHRPARGGGPPRDLPILVPTERQSHFYLEFWNASVADTTAGLPPIHVRPASTQEPRPYLADPVFSTCTVPVVYYGHHSMNFVHAVRDNAGRFYSALLETAWAEHVKIVLMTGEGLNISGMNLALWQPLSKLRVDSWEEFTVRLTGEQGTPAGAFPPSYEGPEQRCFKHMFVCTNDINTTAWRVHGYGQHLARYYQAEKLVQTMTQQQPPGGAGQQQQRQPGGEQQQPGRQQQQQPGRQQLPPPESILRQLGAGGGKAAGSGNKGTAAKGTDTAAEVELRIAFHKRDGDDRQLLNAVELVEACNRWSYTAPSGARVRGVCWQVELPNLAAGIAAAQQADVFVAVHGANIANAALMRNGSSLLEITMFQFEESQGHLNFAKRNAHDVHTQLQYWKLLLCDPDHSWEPGSVEREQRATGATSSPFPWPKYRNSYVRWEALETAFQAIVDTGGDMEQYWERWEQGRWWWLSSADATVFAGRFWSQTCKKARAAGTIA